MMSGQEYADEYATRVKAEIERGDRPRNPSVVILDDDSITTLEAKTTRLVPATIYSRLLAGRATAA